MKKIIYLFLIISLSLNINAQKVKRVKMKTKNDSISYALGISIASNLSKQKIENLNPRAVGRAFQDFYENEAKISADDANKFIQKYFEEQEAKKSSPEEAKKYKQKIEEGEKFLAENAKKDGVKVLESGLQYKVIKEGTGAIPTASDKVKVHYEGTLIDGTKFDSSYDRGEPIDLGVSQVIKGWTEALQLMKEGSTWMLYIPYDLSYGSRGAGKIQPFSTLIFKVELIKIVK